MIELRSSGSFTLTRKYLMEVSKKDLRKYLKVYAEKGVQALKEHTPKRTGKTANSWTYKIKITNFGSSIIFDNTNLNHGVSVALLIYYGHGTKNGGYVQGIDYINPALRPVFQEFADTIWNEVISW